VVVVVLEVEVCACAVTTPRAIAQMKPRNNLIIITFCLPNPAEVAAKTDRVILCVTLLAG
jgi:hypothetical protein